MTDYERCVMLAKEIAAGDKSAWDPLHDLLVENGHEELARIHSFACSKSLVSLSNCSIVDWLTQGWFGHQYWKHRELLADHPEGADFWYERKFADWIKENSQCP